MEDRETPFLYLEMCETPGHEYAAMRVGEVLSDGNVTRATWWENACRDRTDLPRKLPEFSLLGLYEVGDGFTAALWASAGLSALGAVAGLALPARRYEPRRLAEAAAAGEAGA